MAKINFMDRDNLLREFELKEDQITVGREATNTLVIADPSVSRHHATIEKREDGYYLVDKNSSNGTYVNGKRVSQQKLNHKDKVNFGSASVVFEDEEQVAATYILPRPELPEVPKARNQNERPTDALSGVEEMMTMDEDHPLPPPAPLVSGAAQQPQAAPPPPPPVLPRPQAAPAPPPPAPAPRAEAPKEAPVGVLCPNCRKVVESGARFCGFCGTPLQAPKPAAAPAQPAPQPPPQKPAAAAPPPPALKPAPAPAPVAPKPAAPPAPAPVSAAAHPVPSFGLEPGTVQYAGFGVRLVAYLIDAFILGILMVIVYIPVLLIVLPSMIRHSEPSPFAPLLIMACSLVSIVVSIGYQLYFVGAKGATPGKKMMKLRVAMADGQSPIGYAKALLRMIGYMVSGIICYIGFLMIAFDKEQHRGLHDKIAGTVVIKES